MILTRSLYYLSFCLLGFSVLPGCKSVDRVLFRPPVAALNTRLPALEVAVDNGPLVATEGALPADPLNLFRRELRQNLMETADSTKFGYVKLLITSAQATRKGKGFQALQMVTFMTPSLLGLPLETYQTRLRAEVQVMNAQGEIIGTYSGSGTSNVRVAMYYGYSQNSAGRLADVEALRLALNQIRPQLAGAADSLRTMLMAAGPIEVVVGQAGQ